MAEEHPKATLTWRKTEWKRGTVHTLLSWENVLRKEDLPYEYTDVGPHFWDTGDKIHIGSSDCGRFNAFSGYCIPCELYRGQIFGEEAFNRLLKYLQRSCRQLKRAELKVSESEEVVVEIEPEPEPEPVIPDDYDPSVAFDDGAVIDKKPTLLERVERILHGWNTEESKEG